MRVALYTGVPDTPAERCMFALIRKVQKGPFGNIVHTEAIHEEHADGSVTIASASLRDGGVRSKRVTLNPAHWWVVDVPLWPDSLSKDLLARTLGAKYDIRGAIASVFIGSDDYTRWFCNEWCGHPYLKCSSYFSPSQFAAIALSLGQDITRDFFGART